MYHNVYKAQRNNSVPFVHVPHMQMLLPSLFAPFRQQKSFFPNTLLIGILINRIAGEQIKLKNDLALHCLDNVLMERVVFYRK